jgi:hypothetical protein
MPSRSSALATVPLSANRSAAARYRTYPVPGWRARAGTTLQAVRPLVGRDEGDRLDRVVGHMEQVDVRLRDRAGGQLDVAHPGEEAVPVGVTHEDDREVPDLAGLDEGERLEQLVERPEPAGHDHERVRVLHEHRLAGEEVVELHREVHVRVEMLLAGQLDVAADGQATLLVGALVGRLHGAGVRAEPNTAQARPTPARASKPSTNSDRILRARQVSVSRNSGRPRCALRSFSSSVRPLPPRRALVSGRMDTRPDRMVRGETGREGS